MILMISLADISPEVIGLISLVLGGGFITALVQGYKARPERDAVVVSAAQNASEIFRGLNEALYAELDRERSRRHEAEAKIEEAAQRADMAHRRADAAERRALRAEARESALEEKLNRREDSP